MHRPRRSIGRGGCGEYLRGAFKNAMSRSRGGRRRGGGARIIARRRLGWRRWRRGGSRRTASPVEHHRKLAGRHGCHRLGGQPRPRQLGGSRWQSTSIIAQEFLREFPVHGGAGVAVPSRRRGNPGVLEHQGKLACARSRRWRRSWWRRRRRRQPHRGRDPKHHPRFAAVARGRHRCGCRPRRESSRRRGRNWRRRPGEHLCEFACSRGCCWRGRRRWRHGGRSGRTHVSESGREAPAITTRIGGRARRNILESSHHRSAATRRCSWRRRPAALASEHLRELARTSRGCRS